VADSERVVANTGLLEGATPSKPVASASGRSKHLGCLVSMQAAAAAHQHGHNGYLSYTQVRE
jgi:hypothetical protein